MTDDRYHRPDEHLRASVRDHSADRPESLPLDETVTQPIERKSFTAPADLGNVKIDQEIGRGGMGVVFRGWDEVLHRDVAVKFLPTVISNPATCCSIMRGTCS